MLSNYFVDLHQRLGWMTLKSILCSISLFNEAWPFVRWEAWFALACINRRHKLDYECIICARVCRPCSPSVALSLSNCASWLDKNAKNDTTISGWSVWKIRESLLETVKWLGGIGESKIGEINIYNFQKHINKYEWANIEFKCIWLLHKKRIIIKAWAMTETIKLFILNHFTQSFYIWQSSWQKIK